MAHATHTTFLVRVDRELHNVAKNADAVFVGAQCDDCGNGEFDIENWADGWCIVCTECGTRFEAVR